MMDRSIKKLSIVILAGGQSRRFGTNKLFYEINGRSLISKIVNVSSAICVRSSTTHLDKIYLSVRSIEEKNLIFNHLQDSVAKNVLSRIIFKIDRLINQGPLQAIIDILSDRLMNSQYVLVMPIDMPLIETTDLELLVENQSIDQNISMISFLTDEYITSTLFLINLNKFHSVKKILLDKSRNRMTDLFRTMDKIRLLQVTNPQRLLNYNENQPIELNQFSSVSLKVSIDRIIDIHPNPYFLQSNNTCEELNQSIDQELRRWSKPIIDRSINHIINQIKIDKKNELKAKFDDCDLSSHNLS